MRMLAGAGSHVFGLRASTGRLAGGSNILGRLLEMDEMKKSVEIE